MKITQYSFDVNVSNISEEKREEVISKVEEFINKTLNLEVLGSDNIDMTEVYKKVVFNK
ncbi:MAG: hypothetical protein ACLTDM_15270 [Clostridium butyricum]